MALPQSDIDQVHYDACRNRLSCPQCGDHRRRLTLATKQRRAKHLVKSLDEQARDLWQINSTQTDTEGGEMEEAQYTREELLQQWADLGPLNVQPTGMDLEDARDVCAMNGGESTLTYVREKTSGLHYVARENRNGLCVEFIFERRRSSNGS